MTRRLLPALAALALSVLPAVVRADDACAARKIAAHLDLSGLAGDDPVLEVMRQAYRRLANGVAVPLELLVSDDVTWRVEGAAAVPFARTYSGKDGIRAYLSDVERSVCLAELRARFVVRQGDAIHVHLYEEGVAVDTGKRFAMEIAHVWRIDAEGRIAAFREYNDTFALAAAFDPSMEEAASLAAHPADWEVAPSSYPATLADGFAFYAALGRADVEYFLQKSDPALVWILAGPPAITPIAGTFLGVPGLLDFFTRVFGTEQYLDFQVRSMIADGSRIDAEFHEQILVYATGRVFTADGLHTVVFGDDGRLRAFRSYNDTAAVAAGHAR